MAISNCLFSPTSENPRGFSVWCVLAKLTVKPRYFSYPQTVRQHLRKSVANSNILLIFGVSNVKRKYDYFLWLEKDRTDMERNPGQKNTD